MPGGFGLLVVSAAAGVNVDVGVGGGEACRAGDSGDIGAAWRLIRADEVPRTRTQGTGGEARARGSITTY
jgi:hypothetical protein